MLHWKYKNGYHTLLVYRYCLIFLPNKKRSFKSTFKEVSFANSLTPKSWQTDIDISHGNRLLNKKLKKYYLDKAQHTTWAWWPAGERMIVGRNSCLGSQINTKSANKLREKKRELNVKQEKIQLLFILISFCTITFFALSSWRFPLATQDCNLGKCIISFWSIRSSMHYWSTNGSSFTRGSVLFHSREIPHSNIAKCTSFDVCVWSSER